MSGILYAIPIGTPASVCKAVTCRKRIFWIKTGKGNPMPIDVNVEGGKAPTGREPGLGLPHWATCPEAGTFRKARSDG